MRRALARARDPGPLPGIAAGLVARLDDIRITPRSILIPGDRCGTVTRLLEQRYPKASLLRLGPVPPAANPSSFPWFPWLTRLVKGRVAAVVADPRHLPLPDGVAQLAVSNMLLHWSSHPPAVLREWRRVLAPDGLLLFTMAGEETLTELRQCLDLLDRERSGRAWPRVPVLPDLGRLGDWLAGAGFVLPVADRELVRLTLPSAGVLLERLAALGAGNPHAVRHPGLTGKGFVHRLDALYRQRFPAPGTTGIRVTVEILCGHGWRRSTEERALRSTSSS